eukprot:TRINITY_DN7142_c0_g1_i1.p1 TRINITY_DN7142_c0_g1~~TRINITY_DN7142_c0_g1_i1.p1  ORF type:complete len:374 (+),score=38.99 TRINITY_DN7142_c0_g1_i1:218-1339(+)
MKRLTGLLYILNSLECLMKKNFVNTEVTASMVVLLMLTQQKKLFQALLHHLAEVDRLQIKHLAPLKINKFLVVLVQEVVQVCLEHQFFTEKFNKMLENAEIGPDLFDKVGRGLNKLGETSTKLADISNAALATNEYAEKMKKASESIGSFTENYSKSGQVLNESINILSENYQKTAGLVADSGQDFMTGISKSVTNLQDQLSKAGENVSNRITESGNKVATELGTAATGLTSTYKQATDSLNLTYQQLSDAMKANGSLISEGSGGYKEQLERLNKNMSALNAAHELHLQETNQRLKEAEKVYSGVDGMMKKINTSVSETEKFAQALELLNKNISALNSVYGNMLSAMNVMSNGKQFITSLSLWDTAKKHPGKR